MRTKHFGFNFRGSMVPFKRMVVRAPNGTVLEDINDFHLFSKVKDVLYKSKCDLESEFATTKSSLAIDQAMWDTEQQTFVEGNGVPVIFKHTRVCSVKNNSSLFQSIKSRRQQGTPYT